MNIIPAAVVSIIIKPVTNIIVIPGPPVAGNWPDVGVSGTVKLIVLLLLPAVNSELLSYPSGIVTLPVLSMLKLMPLDNGA